MLIDQLANGPAAAISSTPLVAGPAQSRLKVVDKARSVAAGAIRSAALTLMGPNRFYREVAAALDAWLLATGAVVRLDHAQNVATPRGEGEST